MSGLKVIAEHPLETVWGKPSDVIVEGQIGARTVFFLPRHGRGHHLVPSEVPYRANIAALKSLGATHILAVSAVGIMREDIRPGDLVIPDQLIDMTKGIRAHTFYGRGAAGHSLFADPFCSVFRDMLLSAVREQPVTAHDGGTYICIEGPRFSSRAESRYFRAAMNPSVIGMTAMPEASLAREAGLSYALLGLATDYDCWHETEEDVSVDAVLEVLKSNSVCAQAMVRAVSALLAPDSPRPFDDAHVQATITPEESMLPEARQMLAELFSHTYSADSV
ncbi:MAG: MTAP family purine nucleoside phosphorylase [Deltaproteobacteria bacterium]|nr:MTAP family purine nucleoside phosphorylase [Deltaproteobacteria bacterium]